MMNVEQSVEWRLAGSLIWILFDPLLFGAVVVSTTARSNKVARRIRRSEYTKSIQAWSEVRWLRQAVLQSIPLHTSGSGRVWCRSATFLLNSRSVNQTSPLGRWHPCFAVRFSVQRHDTFRFPVTFLFRSTWILVHYLKTNASFHVLRNAQFKTIICKLRRRR
jgi:hypothetical protein